MLVLQKEAGVMNSTGDEAGETLFIEQGLLGFLGIDNHDELQILSDKLANAEEKTKQAHEGLIQTHMKLQHSQEWWGKTAPVILKSVDIKLYGQLPHVEREWRDLKTSENSLKVNFANSLLARTQQPDFRMVAAIQALFQSDAAGRIKCAEDFALTLAELDRRLQEGKKVCIKSIGWIGCYEVIEPGVSATITDVSEPGADHKILRAVVRTGHVVGNEVVAIGNVPTVQKRFKYPEGITLYGVKGKPPFQREAEAKPGTLADLVELNDLGIKRIPESVESEIAMLKGLVGRK